MPRGRKGVEAAFERRLPDSVVDDVDAATARQAPDLRGNVELVVADDVVGARLTRQRRLLLG